MLSSFRGTGGSWKSLPKNHEKILLLTNHDQIHLKSSSSCPKETSIGFCPLFSTSYIRATNLESPGCWARHCRITGQKVLLIRAPTLAAFAEPSRMWIWRMMVVSLQLFCSSCFAAAAENVTPWDFTEKTSKASPVEGKSTGHQQEWWYDHSEWLVTEEVVWRYPLHAEPSTFQSLLLVRVKHHSPIFAS